MLEPVEQLASILEPIEPVEQPPSLDKQNTSENPVTIVNGERYQSHLSQ